MADELFRSYPIRGFGYGWAVGEALVYVARKEIVDLCYLFGLGYMVGHSLYSIVVPADAALFSFLRTILWNILANAVLPTLVVFHSSRLIWRLLADKNIPELLKKWLPCIIGVLICPAIIDPLDVWCDSVVGVVI